MGFDSFPAMFKNTSMSLNNSPLVKLVPSLSMFSSISSVIFFAYVAGLLVWNNQEIVMNPQEVRVQHETCSTICGTPVQAILDQKNLTGLAGGVKEGQNMAQNGPRFYIFLASEISRGP